MVHFNIKRNLSVSIGKLIVFSLTFSSALQAQQSIQDIPILHPHEFTEDIYQPDERDDHKKSPAYEYSIPGFWTVQVNVDEDGNNILNDAANEPSIAIDPTNPNKMAIGWRQFNNIDNNFRQAGFGYTLDGGQSWTFPGVIEPGVFRSDPVLDSDSEGNFYYNSLTSGGGDYWCNVFKSEDGGSNWDNGTYAWGGDKQWMTIDNSGGEGDGHLYAYWNSSFSICAPHFFTRSVDGSVSWEACTSLNGYYPVWGTLTVDREGRLFLVGRWFPGFLVARSSNAQHADQPIIWEQTSMVSLDGGLVGFNPDGPNPSGLQGQVIIDCDRSGGLYDGNLYVLASVQRESNNDPCDVMFSKSTDGGLTWSSPVRINDDPGTIAYQWFGTMSVAPDGRIDVVWLDTRDNPGSMWSALYFTYSMDGGETWTNNVKLSESFDPHVGWPQQNKMGDYFDMISDSDGAHLAWANTFNGEQDVCYAYISHETTGLIENRDVPKILVQNYPNPFRDQTTIQFTLKETDVVLIQVLDFTGRVVSTLVHDVRPAGIHRVIFTRDGIQEGIYYCRITSGLQSETAKIIITN